MKTKVRNRLLYVSVLLSLGLTMMALINVKANMPPLGEGYYMETTVNCCRCVQGMPEDRCDVAAQCCKSTHSHCHPQLVRCGLLFVEE